ncbi:MAG TPA: fibronectin type III domain-containing protein, partial [Flavisolibacter sp.]|nr:fibronectin type III domain-containing protein [Flavisolibacter sp.]
MLHRNSYRVKFSFLVLAMLLGAAASGQNIKVLPGNGKFSPSAAPQGATRAQRQFYLIDSAELAKTGLTSSTILNSIGFTMATPQNRTTKGKFSVYLQNTSDLVSRVDTGWTNVTVVGNSLTLALLNRGNYEWQVRTTCSAASPFSPSGYFEVNRDSCKSPTRLTTANITGTGADLQWIKPSTPVDSFKVEYSRIDSVSWTTHYTKNAYFHVAGLIAGQSYQWKVSSSCSGAAPRETAIFTTVPPGSCATVSGMSVGVVKDTVASVSWSAAQQAIQYEIRYRRAGTATWDYESSITNTATLFRLLPGTKYEWQVRSVCTGTDNGSFADGTPFNTTGAQRCYYPEALYIDSLAGSAAKLSWDTAANATGYEVRYRQLETISWTNAIAGMTAVHKDSITIRDTVGSFHVPFKKGSPFTYSGSGLYVAFEYVNDSTQLSTSNIAPVNYSERSFKNVEGEDSARVILSMGGPSADSLPQKLTALPFRPETWFGSNTLRDSAAVIAVYAMGQNALPYGNPTKASALVRNFANSDKTYAVTLTVKNTANTVIHTQLVNATVKKDSVLLVSFAEWSPAVVGVDSLIVSIPAQAGENVVNNNRLSYLQNVNGSVLSYADNSDA